MSLQEEKAAARKAAFARRKAAHDPDRAAQAIIHLLDILLPHKGKVIAGYMPIRTEVTPVPAMAAMAGFGPVVVPVIQGAEKPLKFREWTPGGEMEEGEFGAKIPKSGDYLEPDVLVVPLVAFDQSGARLGYGGGFYDRSLAELAAEKPILAIGYAYAGQEAESLPREGTDRLLDAVVTENGVRLFSK